MSKKNNPVGTVGFIFISMLLAKLLGQVREIIIAGTYGTGWMADAYVAASQIPTNFFDMILGSAVSAAFIPVFNKFIEQEGEQRAKKFAGSFFNSIFIVSVLLAFLGIVFAPQLISLFTPGLNKETTILAVKLLRILFPMIVFVGAAFTFVGILQSMGEFNIPAIMSVVSSGTCIIYLLTLEKKFGITGLAVSLLLGWVFQFLFLMPVTIKKGFRFNTHIVDSGLKDVVILALPVLIGTWVQPINVMVNTWIASNIGGVSAINYANKLYIIAAGVFAMSVTNYIFPKLSRLSISEEDKCGWMDMFMVSIRMVLFIVTPIAVVFLTESKEIIRVIYQRGSFSEASVNTTGGALMFYSIGILPFALQEIMYKSFYSKRKSVTPMLIALLGIIINIPLSFVLSGVMGINGLALAASISVIVTMIVSFILIAKDTISALAKDILKIVVMGGMAAIVIILVKKCMIDLIGLNCFSERLLVAGIPAVIGCIAYLILAVLLRFPEVVSIIDKFKRKGKELPNEK